MPSLQWIGKDKVIRHHHDVPFRTLEHQYGYRADNPDDKAETNSGNKIIHGDNLEALKALLPEYEGRIDCIYIDPPYNTGATGWVYNDNVDDPQIRKWLGQVVGTDDLEDFSRHDKWLCMMYPRLVLLQKLLSQEGAIFVSIDDNEVAFLKIIMNEIFGSTCFVADISWQRTYSIRNDSKGIPKEVEHILVFSAQPNWLPYKLTRTGEMDDKYKSPDGDERIWTSSSVTAPGAATHQGMVYAIQHPFTGEMMYPSQNRCWSLGQDQMLENMLAWAPYELRDIHDDEKRAEVCGLRVEDIRKDVMGIVLAAPLSEARENAQKIMERGNWPYFYFTNNGEGGLRRKTYLDDVGGRLPTNFFPYKETGHTDEAIKEIKKIFEGAIPFDTPKPVRLIERILQIATSEDSIVLDSFAGSATTAHATLQLNKKDGGNRKFVLIELMDYAESLTAERVRRVMSGYKFEGKKTEELYSKKLTISNIKKASSILEEAQQIARFHEDLYDKTSVKIKDNCLKVKAEKTYSDKTDGLGGAFDYYELGKPLFNEDKNLNEEVGEEKIRQYVYYTETHEYLTRERSKEYPYLLDYYAGTGYFFYYKREELTTLSMDTLNIVPKKAEHYVIYADICTMSREQLSGLNIVFKKIPRDINRF